jgi:hypothetical protein
MNEKETEQGMLVAGRFSCRVHSGYGVAGKCSNSGGSGKADQNQHSNICTFGLRV